MATIPSQLYYAHIHVGEILELSLDHLNTDDLTGFGTFHQFITRGNDTLINRLIDYIEMSIEVHRLFRTPEGANIDLVQEFEKFHDIIYSNLWHRTGTSPSKEVPIKLAPVFFPEEDQMSWSEND